MNTLDIIIIAVIGISAFVGLIKGFIRTVFGLTAVIATIILTIMLTPSASSYIIENTTFDDMISEKSIELLGLQEQVAIDLPQADAVDTIEDLPLPKNIIDMIMENFEGQHINVIDTSGVVKYIGDAISSMAVKALSFLVLFIVISIILNAIVTLLDLVSQLPVLNEMNRLGGFFVGIILGVVMIWVGLLGLSFVISIQATDQLSSLIESSVLTKILYYNNPLQMFIMGLVETI